MFYIKCFIKYICLNEDILCWANTWVVWAKPRMGCDVIRLEKEFPQQRCRSKQSARVKLVQQAASSELRALHRKLTRKFSMQILALCAILRAHLAYWIFYTEALRWHDWARFLPSERGEREIERDRSQQLGIIRICILWLQVFSVLRVPAFLVFETNKPHSQFTWVNSF